MSDQQQDQTLALITALTASDCWLSAGACSVYLGLATPGGKINRRGFLERVACKSSFPIPLSIGSKKAWKKSEVAQWADDERRIQENERGGGR
jgi:hypothetical protein